MRRKRPLHSAVLHHMSCLLAGEAVLENAQLRVEAFDYLQLPFVIKEGSIGRLRLQVRFQNVLQAVID